MRLEWQICIKYVNSKELSTYSLWIIQSYKRTLEPSWWYAFEYSAKNTSILSTELNGRWASYVLHAFASVSASMNCRFPHLNSMRVWKRYEIPCFVCPIPNHRYGILFGLSTGAQVLLMAGAAADIAMKTAKCPFWLSFYTNIGNSRHKAAQYASPLGIRKYGIFDV